LEPSDLSFNPVPSKFVAKSSPEIGFLCFSFTACGSFLAVASDSNLIVIYTFENLLPLKMCELKGHTEPNRLLSGSGDGTARIWYSENESWKTTVFDVSRPETNNNLDLYNDVELVQ
jgi:WD40 repeat protein